MIPRQSDALTDTWRQIARAAHGKVGRLRPIVLLPQRDNGARVRSHKNDLANRAGERPVFDDYEKADLLCEPGDICVLAMPDLRFPYIALPGEQAYRLIENLTRIADQIPVNALARKRLSNLLDGMNAYQRYYEAVCHNAGMPPAYDTADR